MDSEESTYESVTPANSTLSNLLQTLKTESPQLSTILSTSKVQTALQNASPRTLSSSAIRRKNCSWRVHCSTTRPALHRAGSVLARIRSSRSCFPPPRTRSRIRSSRHRIGIVGAGQRVSQFNGSGLDLDGGAGCQRGQQSAGADARFVVWPDVHAGLAGQFVGVSSRAVWAAVASFNPGSIQALGAEGSPSASGCCCHFAVSGSALRASRQRGDSTADGPRLVAAVIRVGSSRHAGSYPWFRSSSRRS